MSETETVLLGIKVRDYKTAPAFLIGHVMTGLRRLGIDCFEAWGIKDPEPEIDRLVREKNDLIQANHELQCEVEKLRREARQNG